MDHHTCYSAKFVCGAVFSRNPVARMEAPINVCKLLKHVFRICHMMTKPPS